MGIPFIAGASVHIRTTRQVMVTDTEEDTGMGAAMVTVTDIAMATVTVTATDTIATVPGSDSASPLAIIKT